MIVNSQPEIHGAITALEIKTYEKLLLFAACRILYLASVQVDIQDLGDIVRLTGVIPYNLKLGAQLNRLGVIKRNECYTYNKNNNAKRTDIQESEA
jgi:hypothetical protein